MRGPKIKFTEDIILEKTYEFIDIHGLDALNTRDLAKFIGCSTQPIFRLFDTIDALLKHTYPLLEQKYDALMNEEMQNSSIPFLGMGLGYIRFATEHPNLFKAMFMSDYFKKESLLSFFDSEENDPIISMISQQTGLSNEKAKELLRNIWLLTHGIATMIAYNEVQYSKPEVEQILGAGFRGFLSQLKGV